MEIDWNAEVVDQMDSHWRDRLRPRLGGLTDDEYFWEPVPGCWSLRRRDDGTGPIRGSGEFTMDYAEPVHGRDPVTTIAWRLAHVIGVLGPPGSRPFDGVSGRSGVEYTASAQAALGQLDEGYEAWMTEVRGLGAPGLARPQGSLSPPPFADLPVARLVMYVHVEVIHHGAEMCLLRDLYAWRADDRTH